jgi:hypothetical protein
MTLVESWRKRRPVWMYVTTVSARVHGQNPSPVYESAHERNALGQGKKPHVMLRFLDGFRYDSDSCNPADGAEEQGRSRLRTAAIQNHPSAKEVQLMRKAAEPFDYVP